MANNSNVILKTIAVLRAFIDEQSVWGVNELARFMDYPVSSLHRILRTLREEGILQIDSQTGKYIVGPEMVRIASIVHSKSDIKVLAEPYLKRLSTAINESVYLAYYYPQHKKLSFIHHIQSTRALQYVLDLGILQPIHIASSGKAILSFLSEEEIQAIFESEKINETEQQTIREEIETIRKNGYVMTTGERRKESIGFGAPIFDANQKVIGSIICAIPSHFYDSNNKEFIIENLIQEANNISYMMGYRP